MRALSMAGLPFGIVSIGAPLLLLTIALGWIGRRRERTGARRALTDALRVVAGLDLRGAARILWWLLLGWLALRFTLLQLPGRIAQPAGRTVLRIAASTTSRERIREIETALAA